jgi:amino acid transporter
VLVAAAAILVAVRLNSATPEITSKPSLKRGVGLWGAASANMLNMIGVGPFITIPLALAAMGGPQAMLGWIVGAFIALCDGMVWAELGAAMPDSGGPYYYLLEAFGPRSFGRLMSFLFLWQAVLIGPISIASGAVGFAQYASYLLPWLNGWEMKVLAALVCLLNTVLLYRDIKSINALSIAMWIIVMGTIGWIVLGGLTHFNPATAFHFPPNAFHLSAPFFAGLGGATLIALYDFGGYYNVCLFGEEVRQPGRTIPRAILISIVVIAALYLLMNLSVISVIPFEKAIQSKAIVAEFVESIYGRIAGQLIAMLILFAAFGSVFAILLGYSRIPYGAAIDGHFFAPFARLHPTKNFPAFSVVVMGVGSALCCVFLNLDQLIKSMIVIQTMVQFAAQCIAVILLREMRRDITRPYKMPLFPIPALIALAGWIFILIPSGWQYVLWAFVFMLIGSGAYLLLARKKNDWPFQTA